MSTIDNSEKFDNIATRINEIKNHFTLSLFENVCQGLFEADKGLFSFLLAVNAAKIPEAEFMQFLQMKALKMGDQKKMIEQAKEMPNIPTWDLNADWTTFFVSENPYSNDILAKFTPFQRLVLIRLLRQDRLKIAIESFVQATLGPKLIDAGHYDLIKCYEDSTNLSPLMFIMPTEVDDPVARILQLANALKFDPEKILIQSITDVGSPELIKWIESKLKQPLWIVIENVHGSKIGLNAIATFVEQLTAESAHADFRLWITTRPTGEFSKSLLQRSVKMIDAPKDGLRGVYKRALASEFPNKTRLIETSPQKALFQSFIPALCLFHGVLLKRHQFKPRGWTFSYEFNESDLQLSFNILFDVLNQPAKEAQLKSAVYLISHCVYGGQLCDPMDERILREFSRDLLNLKETENKNIKIVTDGLARHNDAGVLGLHPELVVDVNFKEVEEKLNNLLKIQDRKDLLEVGALDVYQRASKAIQEILKAVPEPLGMTEINEKFATKDSITNRIVLEDFKLYDQLQGSIRDHLVDLQQHLTGMFNYNVQFGYVIYLYSCSRVCKSSFGL